MTAINQLSVGGVERATATVARAFSSDPMFEWLFPEPDQRARSLRILNRVPVEYGVRYGHVTESSGGMAVAIWMPPGHTVTPLGMVRCGMLGVPLAIGFRPFAKFMAANEVMGKLHKQHVPEPHWYLLIVAVDPDHQGKSLGSVLVKEGLARADEMNCPCYLETSSPRNVPFYERLGFRVVGEAALGGGGPTGWAMRRDRAKA